MRIVGHLAKFALCRRFVVCLMLLPLALGSVAQEASTSGWALYIGRISHSEVIKQMPQYAEAQRNLKDLRAQYESEASRSEKEFQAKFEEFLQSQKDLSPTILSKRQNELQAMMDANIQFRLKVQALLKDAEEELMADVKAVLKDAVSSVAAEQGLNIVINTDAEGLSYLVPNSSRDITSEVLRKLGISVE